MLRQEIKVDSVMDIMKKSAFRLAYKGYYDLNPPALNTMFEWHTTDRELPSSDILQAVVPHCKSQFAERKFTFRVVIYWRPITEDGYARFNLTRIQLSR